MTPVSVHKTALEAAVDAVMETPAMKSAPALRPYVEMEAKLIVDTYLLARKRLHNETPAAPAEQEEAGGTGA